MKKYLTLFVVVLIFGSCAVQCRIIKKSDLSKESETIRLVQNYIGKYDESNVGPRQKSTLPLTFTYLNEGMEIEEMIINMNITVGNSIGLDKTDFEIYWVLDGEKIKVLADSSRPQRLQFLVPHSLWVSIANSNTIGYQIYLDKKDYTVKLSKANENRLKYFFMRSLSIEEQKKPPIPEGRMKW